MSDSSVTPRTVSSQAPLSVGFSRQEYWSGLHSTPVGTPSPGALPNREIEPMSPALEGGSFTSEPPGKPFYIYIYRGRIIFIHTHTLLYTQLYIFTHSYRYPSTDTHAILYIHTTIYTCTLLYTHNYIYIHTHC